MQSTRQSHLNGITLLWDVPLAIASLIAFKLTKFVIGNLYTLYLGVNRRMASEWRVLSADTLDSPLSLPVLMTKGPRWNTHAIIGTVGPFEVEQELALDLEAIANSARSWTAAIYSYPTYRTVGSLGSLDQDEGPSQSAWKTLKLPPGRYSIGLRYYHWNDRPVLPVVKIDGTDAIPAQPVDPDVNRFYKQLAAHPGGIYRFLHSYVFTLLKLRPWLPEGFVRYEFLPVGAPQTDFVYGAFDPGDRLSLTLQPGLIQHFDVYLSLYNRASFPIHWETLTTPTYQSAPLQTPGFYLLRLRPKTREVTTLPANPLTVSLTRG